MKKEKYGALLIGCGHIGKAHISDIYYRDNIEIIGVVDHNIDNAALFARKYGAKSFGTDYKKYLSDSSVDIVIIATYTNSHLPILKDCVAAGKHVLCEKPIAPTLEKSLEFVKIAKEAKTRVLVGHVLRHNKTYQKIAELIRSGAIGKPKLFRMVQNHQALNWDRYKELMKDTSPLVDCGVHYVDIVQWILQEKVVEVSGVSQRLDNDIAPNQYNFAMLNATLEGGAVLNYEVGWSKHLRASNIKDFIGDGGYIRLLMSANRGEANYKGDLLQWYEAATDKMNSINVPSIYKDMYGQIGALIRMIEDDNYVAQPTLDDVESTMKVIYAADQAVRSGDKVRLDKTTQEIIS